MNPLVVVLVGILSALALYGVACVTFAVIVLRMLARAEDINDSDE
ncbi:hypothetical protein [Microbacterium sp. GXS0129]